MGKKKKEKKAKPMPAPKKKQQISMRPEERKRHWKEIKEILLNAKREAESLILKKKLTKERTFTNDDINSFISDLKFKSPEENKKPGPLPKAVSVSKNNMTTQDEVVSSETVTNTYYERWFRLVSTKPTVFEEPQPEETSVVKKNEPLPKGVSSTVRATYDLYKKELMVEEIAKRRKLSVSTIYEHFCLLIGMGAVSIYELLSSNKIKEIARAIKKVGVNKLSDIKSHCPSTISYDDIKLMLSHFKKRSNKEIENK